MSGGLVVMTITAMAIMSNAMFLQHGRHPEPLFSTRPVVKHAPRPAPRVPVPVPRSSESAPSIQTKPVPQALAAPPVVESAPAPPPPPVIPKPSPASVNRAVQRELARLGMYTGAIDGMLGPQTRSAIATWQRAAGMPPTGEATSELLDTMRKPLARAPAASPSATAPASGPSADDVAAAQRRAAELEQEQAAARQAEQLRKVQVALDEIGYGPLTADGLLGDPTIDALRRFQLDNGLAPNGELSDGIIERLVAIGAMKAE
jgi:peptidoglycan hydrolase-like protein with peptidoglycan-binding domain